MNLAELTPAQKLQYMEAAIRAAIDGHNEPILCPYCGEPNIPATVSICCQLFAEASDAIMDRIEAQDNIDFVSNVHDRTAKRMVN